MTRYRINTENTNRQFGALIGVTRACARPSSRPPGITLAITPAITAITKARDGSERLGQSDTPDPPDNSDAPMPTRPRYEGYRSFSYLERGVDYPALRSGLGGRIESRLSGYPLDEAGEERVTSLVSEHPNDLVARACGRVSRAD